MLNTLFVIPARGGSKGLPGKNIRPLAGKPLICHSIDIARQLVADEDICVSTDSQEIIDIVESYGLKVPFVRPQEYATDTATTNDVLVHAVNYYKEKGKTYDTIVLLQPTSPLREKRHVEEAMAFMTGKTEMIVSVKESHAPVVLCHEENGMLQFSLKKESGRRQDIKIKYYEYNGSIYVISITALLEKGLKNLSRCKYVMPEFYSSDIDTIDDFEEVELKMKKICDKEVVNEKRSLILVGGGGHCKAVIEVAESAGYTIKGILDLPSEFGKKILGYEIIGNDDDIPKYVNDCDFIVTLGFIKDATSRNKLISRIEQVGGRLATIIAPTAHVSRHAKIGEGTIILHGVMINASASIGKGCIINTLANIGHDVTVGDYCHVSTGVMISGDCIVGGSTFLGSQSVMCNAISIPANSVFAAGSVIHKTHTIEGIYAGNPAVLKKTK